MRVVISKLLLAAALVLVCELVGFTSSQFTMDSVTLWYPMLAKPFFTPPAWLFGPVWTILYAMMGIAAYFVVTKHGPREKKLPTFIFFVQLLLNGLWSPAFFGMRSPELGLAVIIVLLIAIVITTVMFFRVSKVAGILMLPYLAWVSFATALNAAIAVMN